MKLRHVTPLEDHILYIETTQGAEGVFDVKPYMSSEAFSPLRDYAEFSAVQNGGYFVEWPCGADLSADTIAAHMTIRSPEKAQPARKPDRHLASRG